MKSKILWLFTLVVGLSLITSISYAQANPGKVELSVSATGSLFSMETKIEGEADKSDDEKFVVLALRAGIFINEGLQIEPEFLWTASEGSEPIFSIAGNIVYNMYLQNSNVTPFVLGGYGIGNSVPLFNVALRKTTNGFDVTHFNAGGGLKVFVSKRAAIRIEYRYQKFSYEEEYDYYGNEKRTVEYSVGMHKLLLGVSIFF